MTDSEQGSMVGAAEKVRAVVEEVIRDTPLFVIDITVRGNKGSRVVEVYLDCDVSLGVDDLARVSREVGFILDTEEIIEGSYSLNVSSPGVNRPLSMPRQYKKNTGRTLQVKYREQPDTNVVKITGQLVSTDDTSFVIRPQGGTEARIAFADVVEAKVKLPW